MNRLLVFVLALFLSSAIFQPISAQDQQGSENSLLPEIDPQDIEIRSQFKARFPGLRRQPILGFDPKPRVYQVDPNRMPFMETQEQVVANLPVSSLSRPAPPSYSFPYYSSEINAFGRLGVGSYMSPEAQFWGVHRINPKSYVGGDLDYSSSDGHLDNQQSSFRFFEANGEYATKINDKTRLDFNGGFQNSFNHMFDLPQSTNIPNSSRKEYSGFHFGADLQRFQNTITGWKAQVAMRYFDASLNDAGILSGTSEEYVYQGALAKRWTGNNLNESFTVKVAAQGSNYSTNQLSDNWLTAQGGVIYERLFDYTTKVTADASVYYGSDIFDSKIYIGPSVTVKHPLLEMLTVTIKAGAEPYVKTVEQLHNQNRFLNVNNGLRHSYRINALAEAALEYANVGMLKAGIQYENISDYPIYRRQAINNTANLFFETNYADVYRLKAYASVVHQLISDRLRINAKVYAQSPEISNGGRIPFEEKVGINSGLTIRPVNKITFEAWADYVGSRKTFQTGETLDGYLLIGGKADVEITERIGAYVKLVNLLSQDYEVWQGYTERPFQAYGGITIKL